MIRPIKYRTHGTSEHPRTLIQPSFEGEFRQHDGVVTMMMIFYRRRASPKHRYDIIEVDYGGGGHRTRLRDQEINCCVFRVPPSSVYKGGRRRGLAKGVARPRRGKPTLSRFAPPFPNPRRGKEGVGEGKGKGAPPPFPCPIRTQGEGKASCPGRPLSLSSPLRPNKAH